MNKELKITLITVGLLIVGTSSCATYSSPKQSGQWITPSSSICQANGGKIDNGVCHANWQKANSICLASGGRLPALDEFTQLIKECGGVVADYNFFSRGGEKELLKREAQNRSNTSYQQCYKTKGFLPVTGYWSSKEYIPQTKGAWYVRFEEGATEIYQKAAEYAVRCTGDM